MEKVNIFQQGFRPASHWEFGMYELVQKVKGSEWCGIVVGFYHTGLTERGYAVESSKHKGSVQIYPESALEPWDGEK